MPQRVPPTATMGSQLMSIKVFLLLAFLSLTSALPAQQGTVTLVGPGPTIPGDPFTVDVMVDV